MPELHVHGTPDYEELAARGWTPADVAIFSSNINPYGPPPAVIEAVRAATDTAAEAIATYPDRFSSALRRAIGAYHDVDPAAILVGNGTADIMWLLAHACAPGRHAVVVEPTFSEYRNSLSLVGARVTSVCHPGWRVDDGGRFHTADHSLAACAAAIAAAAPDLVFICNPNNPTGHVLTLSALEELHAAAPAALWIVDEAYADFTAAPWSIDRWAAARVSPSAAGATAGGWIVLRSMTKDFALGGLRVGYLIGHPDVVAQLYAAQPPWNVNNFAQLAGIAALTEIDWRTRTVAKLRQQVAALQATLRGHGFAPYATAVNYFLLPVDNATDVRAALFAQGLVVRDCTSFGLPEMIRIAAQLPAQEARLAAALASYAKS